jgi:hypothetical protein
MPTVTKLEGNVSFSWFTEEGSGMNRCLDTLLTSGKFFKRGLPGFALLQGHDVRNALCFLASLLRLVMQ